MRSSSTFSILFWIYATRAVNEQADIYARITINGKRVNISLKQKVEIKIWDPNRQKAKGNGHTQRQINFYLDETKSKLVQCYRDLNSSERTPTPKDVKAKFLGEDIKPYTLQDIIDFHNDKMKHKLSLKTMCHYKTSQNYLKQYLNNEYNINDIQLKELDYPFVIGFEDFLRSYKPHHYQGKIGNNAVMKHIQRLRKMITLAFHMEWIDKDPFVKFKPVIEKKEREFLTEQELNSIEGLGTSIERISVVRDLFLFSCYTGISYGDIMDLTDESLVRGIDGNRWIMSRRNKTGVAFKIPVLPSTDFILKKYKNHPRTSFHNNLLPIISNQRMNSYLKEIADLCGIKKNLTFHMARHTFATTVTLSNGVPIETVSKLLGHTKISTTQVYARVIEQKICDDMVLLNQKFSKRLTN